MKAIRVEEFGGPEKLVLREVADPQPGPGQLVVRIRAAGVNPVETYIRTGTYGVKLELPYTPGADGAGEVLRVGEGVSRYKPGDRVYAAGSMTGTYAEQALCAEAQVHPLPAQATFAQGAALGVPYGTAYRALFHIAHAQPAETVLVHGASGGVGTAAVQLARSRGLTVIGTAGTERGRELVQRNGAHHALDHHAPDFGNQIASLTAGGGVNIILEMLANKNLATDLQIVARFGRVVVIGNRGTIEINPRDAMTRDARILGMTLFNASPGELAVIHAALGAALESGGIHPVIGQEIPLAEAARAHQAVMEPGAYGKIVLVV
ncbi:MAG: NADPH:quinone reductase [Acidobacteria bacterium]|nr:NADPH:quinone reductase [Acidobacteriota bacterium]